MSPVRAGALALSMFAAVCVASCARFGARGDSPSEGSAAVFVSADMRGYLAPCGCSENMRGGIYRAAHQVLQAREAGGEVYYVDGGDSLFPKAALTAAQVPQEERKAQALAEAFRLMGLGARAAGERDRARGEAFLAGLGLPEVAAGQAKVFGPAGRKVGVAAGGDAATLAAGAAKARAAGARFVIGLFDGTVAQAAGAAETAGLPVELIVSSRAEAELDGEESRLLRGRIPVARVQSKGRSLMRVDVSFAAQGGHFELLTSDAEVAREVEALGERIALLDRQLNQPGMPEEAKALRRAKLAELVDRREALAAAKPASGAGRNAFSVRFIPLESTLPAAPAAREIVERYDRDVGKLNLAWAKAHGTDCPPAAGGEPAFVGNTVCLACHPNAQAVYDGSKHARGYDTLEELGKQYHLDCVGCHVTGWQRPGGVCRVDKVEGRGDVGCESCHGPGSLHLEKPVKETIALGKSAQACVGCHDPENSPHFDFAQYLPVILGPGHGQPMPPATDRGP